MKHLLIVATLLISVSSFGQKVKGSQKNTPAKSEQGTTVSNVAKTTHDGQVVSDVASSKAKAYKYGQTKDRKKVKATKVKKNTIQKGKTKGKPTT